MLPVVDDDSGGKCVSDADGMLTIPHLGTNRYALSVTPPDGQTWIQTTTLEGNHDWDSWVMEGSTGLRHRVRRGWRAGPAAASSASCHPENTARRVGAGHIKGVVVGIKTYTPPKGGSFDFWGGNTGTKVDHPIERAVAVARRPRSGDAGRLGRPRQRGRHASTSPACPDGNYSLSWWDEPQDYNLNSINVTVDNGEIVDMGNLPLNGWWTEYDGLRLQRHQPQRRRDAGEQGVRQLHAHAAQAARTR